MLEYKLTIELESRELSTLLVELGELIERDDAYINKPNISLAKKDVRIHHRDKIIAIRNKLLDQITEVGDVT